MRATHWPVLVVCTSRTRAWTTEFSFGVSMKTQIGRPVGGGTSRKIRAAAREVDHQGIFHVKLSPRLPANPGLALNRAAVFQPAFTDRRGVRLRGDACGRSIPDAERTQQAAASRPQVRPVGAATVIAKGPRRALDGRMRQRFGGAGRRFHHDGGLLGVLGKVVAATTARADLLNRRSSKSARPAPLPENSARPSTDGGVDYQRRQPRPSREVLSNG